MKLIFHAISRGLYITLSEISRVNPEDKSIAISFSLNIFNTSHWGRFLLWHKEDRYTSFTNNISQLQRFQVAVCQVFFSRFDHICIGLHKNSNSVSIFVEFYKAVSFAGFELGSIFTKVGEHFRDYMI